MALMDLSGEQQPHLWSRDPRIRRSLDLVTFDEDLSLSLSLSLSLPLSVLRFVFIIAIAEIKFFARDHPELFDPVPNYRSEKLRETQIDENNRNKSDERSEYTVPTRERRRREKCQREKDPNEATKKEETTFLSLSRSRAVIRNARPAKERKSNASTFQ